MKVIDNLGLSFNNSRALNQVIDELPHRASWQRRTITMEGKDESFQLFYRNPLDCVKALYGSPAFAEHLLVAPELQYSDDACNCADLDGGTGMPPEGPFCDGSCGSDRMFNEVNTGDWWWKTQVSELVVHRDTC